MKEIDFERAAMLLGLFNQCVNNGPLVSSIQGEVGEELKAINEECRQNALERADRIRKEEQLAKQKQLQEAKAAAQAEADKPKPEPTPHIQPIMPGEPVNKAAMPTSADTDADGVEDEDEDDDPTAKVDPVVRRPGIAPATNPPRRP